jgi:hypothetical protein
VSRVQRERGWGYAGRRRREGYVEGRHEGGQGVTVPFMERERDTKEEGRREGYSHLYTPESTVCMLRKEGRRTTVPRKLTQEERNTVAVHLRL